MMRGLRRPEFTVERFGAWMFSVGALAGFVIGVVMCEAGWVW